ncbi:MAG: class I SAM-dependent methyltransferase [Alphaproteobacteria bacterium]|jgi:NADH dehydrogenase [ubiquinone] 1 alpha subcomplex assembly factor 7|nr:class I SAM-dependent methyltransferase [Alphaproteobacteria bacterium]MBT4964852.1 class I SAM-dependent methyltransferase [Alphaproteobacteria bacterium]MBT5159244.1 class I SAM-dependent methyltransferase [Alphaproteobacteria bacterium]MBT5917328.1 class I SAM-dependent methyltransferase [Alphaproteobacteria bacterium]MBT6384242.1 class I SAM-dependent methyltransferase [Alphaproteobacteria bacterium]
MSADIHSQALAKHFADLIRATGPVTVERWMADCLGHPEHGYYITRDPFGTDGDFITAPEVSQMFGELLGLWCAQTWMQMGSPNPVRLIELGPGRGTLMADAMRAAKALPAFVDAVDIHLVETSPVLREKQKETLSGYQVNWHDNFEDVPPGPALVLANELFDALPIRQFIKSQISDKEDVTWLERLIDLDPEDGSKFRFVASPGPSPAASLLSIDLDYNPDDSIAEMCPAGLRLAHTIGARLAVQGGAGLFIDYGYGQSQTGDSLQALLGHAPHPVLEQPGNADITAHVDFSMLARSAMEAGASVHKIIEQGLFLTALGLDQRAAMLKSQAPTDVVSEIDAAHQRLTAPDQMGTLFKVLAISHPDLDALAGFEDIT